MKKTFLHTAIAALLVLLNVNGGQAQVQTYYIGAGNLVNCPSNCGSTGSYYSDCAGGQPGFQWTSIGGTTPTSVTIELSVGVECGGCCGNGLTRTCTLNGGGQPSFNTNDWCQCDNSNNGIITITANPANYAVGGVNTFLVTNASSCFGYIPSGSLAGYYARITVNYTPGPPCSWSGSSGWSAGTPPCGSFTTGSVGSGTYTYFNIEAGANYTISTCGSSFDTQLSIYVDYGSGWTYQAGNNDNGPDCGGTAASLNWTSSWTTGNAIAVVNRNNCQQHDWTGTSAVLKYRKNCGCSGPQASSTWTGSVNSDWFNAGNWTNCVPGTITNAVIPVVGTMPVINSSPAYVNTITVNPGATITINAPGTLTPSQ